MIRERDALRRAIAERPDDDTLRLAFADWLDENGEPERAAFIRAQFALTRGPLGSRAAAVALRTAARLFRPEWLWEDLPELAAQARVVGSDAASAYLRHPLGGADVPVRVLWRRGFPEVLEHSLGAHSPELAELRRLLPGHLRCSSVSGVTSRSWPGRS